MPESSSHPEPNDSKTTAKGPSTDELLRALGYVSVDAHRAEFEDIMLKYGENKDTTIDQNRELRDRLKRWDRNMVLPEDDKDQARDTRKEEASMKRQARGPMADLDGKRWELLSQYTLQLQKPSVRTRDSTQASESSAADRKDTTSATDI